MKRLFLFCLLLSYPNATHAAEQAVIGNEPLDCKNVTYLQHVDMTVGDNCARSLHTLQPERTFFTEDPLVEPLQQTWALPYAFSAPTYAPIRTKTLAILDTGFTTTSSWLQSFVSHTYDVTSGSTTVHDTIHHGTAVAASAILAMQHAPANVIIVKIDNNGSLSIPNIVKGIDYAIEQGADVINMSLGGTYKDEREQHAIERALEKNITIVAASGNEGHLHNMPNYPASYDGVLSIGAINAEQQRAHFSSYNAQLSFVAPGAKLPLPQQDIVKEINGTSFASPFVAGLIAATQQYSDSSPTLLKAALQTTATDIAAQGFDTETGYGLIDANKALHWLRGDEQPLLTTTNSFITITFSHAVAIDSAITLYKDGQIVPTTTTVRDDEAIVTPAHITYGEHYTLKIDRDVKSASGVAISEPMYVPIQFEPQLPTQ